MSGMLAAQEVEPSIQLGGQMGWTYYTGDASSGLSAIRLNPQFALEGSLRRDLRMTWFAELDYFQLKGNTRDVLSALPYEHMSFKTHNVGLLFGGEYSWFRYALGYRYLNTKRWSPFVGLGLGLLWSYERSSQVSPQLSFRLGLKYALTDRLHLKAQYSWSYSTSDALDALGETSVLASPIGISTSLLRHGDSFGSFSVGGVYVLGLKQVQCN